MNVPEWVINLFVLFATSFITWFFGRKYEQIKIKNLEVETEKERVSAEKIVTDAAVNSSGQAIQYWKDITADTAIRNGKLEKDNEELEKKVSNLTFRMESVERYCKTMREAFEYLAEKVQHDYPEDVKRAREIIDVIG